MMWLINLVGYKRILYTGIVIGAIVVITAAYKVGSELERGKKARELLKTERQKTTILSGKIADQNKVITDMQAKMQAFENEAITTQLKYDRQRADLAEALRANRVWSSGAVPGDIAARLRARAGH